MKPVLLYAKDRTHLFMSLKLGSKLHVLTCRQKAFSYNEALSVQEMHVKLFGERARENSTNRLLFTLQVQREFLLVRLISHFALEQM